MRVSAIMAMQFVEVFVVGHRYVATRAVGRPTTGKTLIHRRIPASVLEQNDLFSVGQTGLYSREQVRRKHRLHLFGFGSSANIRNLDFGHSYPPRNGSSFLPTRIFFVGH